jgi:Carboxypeptidase regulatory-like domain/TonB-dependent Receptor Plug Domain/TonB dependent receptor
MDAMLTGCLSWHERASSALLVLALPFFLLAFTIAISQAAFAQITAATLTGTIRDQTGALLPGVEVVATNAHTGFSRSAVTDANGYFAMPGLPPGTYELRASLPGFGTAVERVTLTLAQEAGLDLTLKVEGAQESVTVVGLSPIVDTRSGTLSAVVTEATIATLPLNGRNYVDLALLQPGVANFNEKENTGSSNRGTKLNINGMTFRSNSYLLDGANMRGYHGTVTGSVAGTTLGVETIQEFRVVTNAYSADYGRAMGGVVSLVTKSGSNTFRGSGFEFFRDSSLDARDFFDRGSEPPPFRRHQFGGSLGGPIRKDRLFFFGGAERLQEDLGITALSYVPNDAARAGALGPINPVVRPYLDLYPGANGSNVGAGTGIGEFSFEHNQPTRENLLQGRLDYRLGSEHTVFARYTFDGADQTNTIGFPDYETAAESRNQYVTSEYNRAFTSDLLSTTRFSHSRILFEQWPLFPSVPELAFIDGQSQMGVINVGGLTSLGGTAQNPNTSNSFYWTVSEDVSYVKGSHLLKVGALIEHLRTDKLTATNVRGSYFFANLRAFLAGRATRFVGVPPGAQLERVRPNTLFGFYVQDDYRATDRLTLNLGLRYECYTVPAERYGLDTTLRNIFTDTSFTVGPPFRENPSLGNWAPRVGVAWDPKGDGRTAIRGGVGLYHDTDGPFNSAFLVATFSPPFAATATISNPSFPRPESLTADAASARTLDYDIQQPYGLAFNITMQRELAGRTTATVGYAGSRGYGLISAIEANPIVPVILADGTKFFPAGASRRNVAFGPIDYRTNGGRSRYHSLQLGAQRRFSEGYALQVAYTLGKALDNQQAQLVMDVNNSSVYPPDPYDRDIEWARSDFDVRHVFSANFIWDLPGRAGHALLGGWQFNGIVTLRSGVPFTPALGPTNWSRSGNTSGEDRPNLRPGIDVDGIVGGGPDRYFDASAFVLGPQGFLGNAGRNILDGPRYAMTNVSLVKSTRVGALGTGGRLQLRVEVFNLLNHPNFATPDRIVFAAATPDEAPLATAGRITRTITSSRQVQLGIKVLF